MEMKWDQIRKYEMSPGLLRQRRNLILLSIFHLLFEFGKVEMKKVGLLGTELVFGRPETVMWFAWALWLYFLFRYWQYYATEELRPSIKNDFDQALLSNLVVALRRSGKLSHIEDGRGEGMHYRFGVRNWSNVTLDSINPVTGASEGLANAPAYMLWTNRIRAAAAVSLETTKVTDYLMPFALAGAALIVSAMNWYVGAPT